MAKVVMNRQAVEAAELGMADALYELGLRIAADAVSTMGPGHLDAPPYGEGLIASAGVGVWARGRKVAGEARAPASLTTPGDQVVMAVGFGSPLAHLHELGTIKMIARPFLTPAFNRHIKDAAKTVVPAMGKRIRAVPG